MHEAATVARGLIEAGTRRPDLVVLDLGLPDGDGVDLIRDLRTWSAMPIIVLSARSAEASKIAALDAGAARQVRDADEMIARALELLDTQAPARRGETAGEAFTARHRGASARTLKLVERLIA